MLVSRTTGNICWSHQHASAHETIRDRATLCYRRIHQLRIMECAWMTFPCVDDRVASSALFQMADVMDLGDRDDSSQSKTAHKSSGR